MPKLDFPRFNGENSHLWQSRSEKYFAMYAVSESLWLSVAEMHLDGSAALWFQSLAPQLPTLNWLHDRFGRDQKELLIRQLFSVHQTSTVADYITQFTELVDQLTAYSSNTDPMYFTMRFIDGLRPDIKSVVLVMWPPDLDTACAIAMLQEEEGAISPTRSPHRGDWSSAPKALLPPRVPLLLLAPPPRPDKAPAASTSTSSPSSSSNDAALKAIKAYHRTLGLCFKCNAKWSRDHRCAPEILHAVEAIWDSFSSDDSLASSDNDSPDSEQVFLAISKSALSGVPASRTIRLLGNLQQIPV
jgi:hypothetical protein